MRTDWLRMPWQSRNFVAFWLLGLCNNTSWVLMNAGAKEISPCLVGLVYIANVVPSMGMKVTLPCWQHCVAYRTRVVVATTFMASSLVLVVVGHTAGSPYIQLIGVASCAIQTGIGEGSILALTASYDTRSALTAWSSGTGFAGIFGYGYLIICMTTLEMSYNATMLLGLCIPVVYSLSFFVLLEAPESESVYKLVQTEEPAADQPHTASEIDVDQQHKASERNQHTKESAAAVVELHGALDAGDTRRDDDAVMDLTDNRRLLGFQERLGMAASMWRFMVPLFIVYFAEYALQSGAWAAMGFPVEDSEARNNFYKYSNWAYQAGVFLSRSSGMLFELDMVSLWGLPLLQVAFLAFFWLDAVFRVWYDWSLLFPCFLTGLIGGMVYVGAFTLISKKVPQGPMREFCLATASVADSAGILCANVLGIYIQEHLYKLHGLEIKGGGCSR